MNQENKNICEYLRQSVIEQVFEEGKTVHKAWPVWEKNIHKHIGKPPYSVDQIIELSEHIYDIFKSTGESGRGQSSVSGGGSAWEGLVCWYLNLCLIGSRAVIIKPLKRIIPTPISDATTVKYNSFKSNTESDLVGLIFPDKEEYTNPIKELESLNINNQVDLFDNNKFNYKQIIDFLTARDFEKLEVCVIQCKTNWNDNAQIPMLWDMIYRTKDFIDKGIVVGHNNYSIKTLNRFSYCFATVPSNNPNDYKTTSTSVQRVRNLSGGNYWGMATKNAIAESLSEMIGRNFQSAFTSKGLRNDLHGHLEKLQDDYSYFKL